MPLVREAGRIVVELEDLGLAAERARARHRMKEAMRISRRCIPLRSQLLTLEAALADRAKALPRRPLAEVLAERAAARQRGGGGQAA
jgi:hypothetical protein